MNKIVMALVLLLSLFSSSANAYDDADTFCGDVAYLAKSVMQARVDGMGVSEAAYIANNSDPVVRELVQLMVIDAYISEEYQGENYSYLHPNSMAAKYYLSCISIQGDE